MRRCCRGLYRPALLGGTPSNAKLVDALPFFDSDDMRRYAPLNAWVRECEGPFAAAVFYDFTAEKARLSLVAIC